MKECFQVGLYRQGFLHDLSKYTWQEFWVGCRYYQGNRSPNNAEREDKGFSAAWLHHKGRNKHHYEYWIDYGLDGSKQMIGMKMPVRYVAEMFLDRIAASKVYKGEAYRDSDPLEYFRKGGTDGYLMHEDTKELLERLLLMLAEKGEKQTFCYLRNTVLKKQKGKSRQQNKIDREKRCNCRRKADKLRKAKQRKTKQRKGKRGGLKDEIVYRAAWRNRLEQRT